MAHKTKQNKTEQNRTKKKKPINKSKGNKIPSEHSYPTAAAMDILTQLEHENRPYIQSYKDDKGLYEEM